MTVTLTRPVASPPKPKRGITLDTTLTVAAVVLTVAVVALPLGYLFYGSLRSAPPGTAGAGFTLQNWTEVYLGTKYRLPLLHTMLLSTFVAFFSVVVGTGLAWAVARTDVPGRRSLGLLLVLPIMISPLLTSLAWIALAAPRAGFINALWQRGLGMKSTPFDIYSFRGIAFVMVLHYAGFAYLAVLAALRNMDTSLEEASRMLGARSMRTALRMTLPLVWPAVAASFLLVFVLSAENFSVPTMLGSPVGFETIPSQLFQLITVQGDPTRAAAVGTMLLWIAVVGTIWQRRILRRARRYVTVGGKGASDSTVRLGKGRLVAWTLCWIYLALAVIMPYLALLLGSFMKYITPSFTAKLFTLDNYRMVTDQEHLLAFTNSLVLCAVSALVTAVLAVLLSYLIQRRLPRRISALTDQVVMVPSTASAMVLGIGFLWAFLALPGGIYGTWLALGIAYATRYLGYGVRTSSSALVQISPELEEAARTQGASGLRAFWSITFPLMRSSVISLWMLLFVLFFLEISATILLYTPNTQTYSVLVWNQLANNEQPAAFAMAVIQSTVIFIILAIGQRLFGMLQQVADR